MYKILRSVYKEFPRYNLSTEIKDHKFWRFKTLLYNHHSSKPGHIPALLETELEHTHTTYVYMYILYSEKARRGESFVNLVNHP